MKRDYFFVLFILSITSILGCAKDPIELVKKGTLSFDTTATVGGAFEGYKYFISKQWKPMVSDQKRQIVEFRGDINLDSYKGAKFKNMEITPDDLKMAKEDIKSIYYLAQFAISTDGKSFELKYNGFELNQNNGQKKDYDIKSFSTIKNIYNNSLDEAVLNLISNYADVKKLEEEGKIAKKYREEALQALSPLWGKILTKCGDSTYFMRGEKDFNDLYEIKGKMTISIQDGQKVEKPSLADSLSNKNAGSIEWAGRALLNCEAIRTVRGGTFVGGYGNWEAWNDSRSPFIYDIIKSADGWKFKDKINPIDCSDIPSAK